jgi:hypothetical protein
MPETPAIPPWHIRGSYFETCNCDYLCPCPESQLRAEPTHGACIAAMAFRIDKGRFGSLTLDALAFITVLRTPGPMIEGGWTLGVIVDEAADGAGRAALAAIGGGRAGGPLGRFALLTEDFAGVAYRPIVFTEDGLRYALSAGDALDQALEGVKGGARPDEPIYLDNIGHPANSRLALARATRSHVHVFGIDWDETGGANNGHFAPFDWHGP